ncbi:MAG: thiamine-phosphate kinase [Acidobacteria bacterium]|nr:thiamine-phosphate kinase [Acidobacteriota bacterium]
MRSGLPSEVQMIREIQKIASRPRDRRLALSIGDDAAAFRMRRGRLVLISTDALVEGIHFDFRYCSAEDLGWKALAVNLSDIAAMGGTPLYVTTSIALPSEVTPGFVRRFYRGLTALARQHEVTLIGGDTCRSPRGIFLDVTIIGEVEPRRMLTRRSGMPGDLLYVTGELGGSAIGLEMLSRSRKRPARSVTARRHLRPLPRCTAGRFLAERRLPSAMIDLSDGLSTDLNHLCRQSGVGAMIEASQIPLPGIPIQQRRLLSKDPLHYALHGGEDYELLFAVPSRLGPRVPKHIHGLPVHEIGCLTRTAGVWLLHGNDKQQLLPGGFDHFAP